MKGLLLLMILTQIITSGFSQKKIDNTFYIKRTNGAVIFKVDTVSNSETILEDVSFKHGLAMKMISTGVYNGKFCERFYIETEVNDSIIEGYLYADSTKRIVPSGGNSFIEAMDKAYDLHLPLIISPDMIWLLITEGFSLHVNLNSASLQKMIVNHKNKKNILVRRDDFRKGQNNPWNEVFPVFADSLDKYIKKDLKKLIVANFSTTGENEKIAYSITLMETVASYFTYTVETACGFPEIILEGTTSDWQWIRKNVLKLKRYGLQKWVHTLIPILDQFVEASKGKINRNFWRNMYKYTDEYSQRYINGWIINFFPYVSTFANDTMMAKRVFTPNNFLNNYSKSNLTIDYLPVGISKVDFIWKYYGKQFLMNFYAGFIGIVQDPKSKALKPLIGWAVCEKIK